MPGNIEGFRAWGCKRDDQAQREYSIVFLVRMDALTEGPKVALDTPGLPQPGDWWNFLDDEDVWAYCTAEVEVDPVSKVRPNRFFLLTYKFNTKPPEGQRCGSDVGHPLCEPAKVSGRYVRRTEEALYASRIDYYGGGDVVLRTVSGGGIPILNSAHEQIRGPAVEFDRSHLLVKVEINRAFLDLPMLEGMIDHVNDATLWGFPPRCVKLSDVSWEKKYYGSMTSGTIGSTGTGTKDCPDLSHCNPYYTLTLEFECDDEKFDRSILDEGTRVLRGRWDSSGNWILIPIAGNPPDPLNPSHFDRFKDKNAENCRVILDGAGLPMDTKIGTGTGVFTSEHAGRVFVSYYPEANFLLLGIPTSF